MSRLVIDGATVVTMDAARSEHPAGHVVVDGNRIEAVGAGPVPQQPDGTRRVDGTGCLLTPGLVNTHHHLYQWVTRGGPQALTVRDALEMGTMGGAAVLGRQDEIGSLEPGKLADLALWRLDTMAHADVVDPVAVLVLGAPPPLELLLVDGADVVRRDQLVGVDEDELATSTRAASAELLRRVS